MAKSVKRSLYDAAELVVLAEVAREELVIVRVWGASEEVEIQLKPEALARVFRALRVPRTRLNVSTGRDGDVHFEFRWRGARWSACLLAKYMSQPEFQDLLAESTSRIEQRQLGLPCIAAAPA